MSVSFLLQLETWGRHEVNEVSWWQILVKSKGLVLMYHIVKLGKPLLLELVDTRS